MRAGSEDPSLDAAYRHVAACGACREAMGKSNVVSLGAAQRRTWVLAVAAAAAVVAAVGASRFAARGPEPVAITQRAMSGWMGDHAPNAPPVAPEDRNVEIRVATKAGAAVMLIADGEGRSLGPLATFKRDGADLVAVVAPRVFAAHAGPAYGLVVIGSTDGIAAVAHGATSPAGATLDAIAKDLAARAGEGARVERITIGAP
jgi:hypothetical protein